MGILIEEKFKKDCFMRFIFSLLVILHLSACTTSLTTDSEKLILTPVSYDELEGWQQDKLMDALLTFRNSCEKQIVDPALESLGSTLKISSWHMACGEAQKIVPSEAAARSYFMEWFRPYLVSGKNGDEGLFTGYFVPELSGARQQGGKFQTPLYKKPDDIITVDLGAFKSDLKGQHIVGKIEGRQLIPYDSRSEITKGSLLNRAQPLIWVDDPLGAFFLEVQGSGHIKLKDGRKMSVGYDGSNGHAYVAIGRLLAEEGDIDKPVSLSSIKRWLLSHPNRAQDIMNRNPSYIFFRILPDNEVIGSEGVALTPQRSLAVDKHFIPLGLPLWLDTLDAQALPFQHLMVAQDTGGAIIGPVRGDVFWGEGDTAAAEAGAMQSRGRYYLFLPQTVDPHDL